MVVFLVYYVVFFGMFVCFFIYSFVLALCCPFSVDLIIFGCPFISSYLLEQGLINSSGAPPVYDRVCIAHSLVLYVVLFTVVCLFAFFSKACLFTYDYMRLNVPLVSFDSILLQFIYTRRRLVKICFSTDLIFFIEYRNSNDKLYFVL